MVVEEDCGPQKIIEETKRQRFLSGAKDLSGYHRDPSLRSGIVAPLRNRRLITQADSATKSALWFREGRPGWARFEAAKK
jgi:hypothetical protein